jgi:hypothetical protein
MQASINLKLDKFFFLLPPSPIDNGKRLDELKVHEQLATLAIIIN